MPSANSKSEKETEYYREVVRRLRLDKNLDMTLLGMSAKLAIAEARHYVPDASDETIRIFLASVAGLMVHLAAQPVHGIADVLEKTYNSHMLAAAALMGIVDLDEGDHPGPSVKEILRLRDEEEKARAAAGNQETAYPDTGMYL